VRAAREEDDVFPRLRQPTPEIPPNRSGSDHGNSHGED